MLQRTVHGVDIPALGFGTWRLSGDDAERGVRTALDVGYRHVDTAQVYGNEEAVGRGIAGSGVDRDEVFVTTKVPREEARADRVVATHEESLGRLGLDHVDLLLIHWPADVPIEETVGALDSLRERGLTRLIGVSNYTPEQFRRALEVAPVATDQVEYHVFLGQEGVREVAREHDVTVTAYSPLARGDVLDDDTLRDVAEAHDCTPVQVALAWLLQQPEVIAIPKASSEDHIRANLAALDVDLTDDEVARIDALPKDRRQIDPPFAPW